MTKERQINFHQLADTSKSVGSDLPVSKVCYKCGAGRIETPSSIIITSFQNSIFNSAPTKEKGPKQVGL